VLAVLRYLSSFMIDREMNGGETYISASVETEGRNNLQTSGHYNISNAGTVECHKGNQN